MRTRTIEATLFGFYYMVFGPVGDRRFPGVWAAPAAPTIGDFRPAPRTMCEKPKCNPNAYRIKEEGTTFDCVRPSATKKRHIAQTVREVVDMTKTVEEENRIASHSNSKAASVEIEGMCENKND